MRRPSSTNKRIETGIEIKRFLVLFSNVWKRDIIYKADKKDKSTDSWPTPISALKKEEVKKFQMKEEVKKFQMYWVCLLIK